MKKFLGILVLGLLWCNTGISGENKFTVRDLNINLPGEYELEKIGTNAGDAQSESPYKNVFYAQTKEGKLVGLLETFYLDYSSVRPYLYDWVKKIFF